MPLRRRLWLAAVLLAVLVGLAPGVSVQSNTSDTGAALAPAPDAATLLVRMYAWRNDPHYVHTPAHTVRWDRALLAFGQPVTDATLTPMTAAEAQGLADRGWPRWVPVAAALAELEAQDTAQATDTPAQADPYADLIAQMYEWRNDPHSVHNPAYTARWDRALLAFGEVVPDATLTPMTAAEAQELADRGWERWVPVAAALAELEAPATAIPPPSAAPSPPATRAAPPPPDQCTLPDDAITVSEVTGWRDALDPAKASAGIKRWNRVLEALGTDTGTGVSAMTAAQAQKVSAWLKNTRWERTARTLAATATCVPPPPPTPEISITAGSAITEGSAASFTLTASPAPAAALDVSVAISQSGAFATPGAQTVTITTTGSASLAVPTTNDSADEPDGSVTATLSAGAGYTVATAAHAATVAVADDDEPELSIASDGDVTEGSAARFTVTASPPPHAALSASVTVSAAGAFGVSAGAQSLSIPPIGAQSFTVSTTGDATDEPDGSITATLASGTGYTVSASAGSATAAIADDDDPPPTPDLDPAPEAEETATPDPDTEPEAEEIAPACVWPADAVTVAEVTGWRDEYSAATHQSRWNRVLEALGEDTGSGEAPMTAAQARDIKSQINNSRWDRTVRTLEALEQCAGSTGGDPQQDAPPDTETTPDTTDTQTSPTPSTPSSRPEISVVGGSAVTEGGDVTFTVTAHPAPTGTIAITFVAMVTQAGSFTSNDGQVVTSIGPAGSTPITVSTVNDDRDEADGSITVTLQADTRDTPRYTVSATQGAATVVVADDDAPGAGPPVTYTAFWAPYQALIAKAEAVRNHPLYRISSAHTDL